jgi:Na+/citrate or Na+/malate symporter
VTAALGKALRAFGHFWWDFLIGDTPEFAVAVGLLVGLAFALDHQRVVAAIVLPLLATAFLLGSTLRGRRAAEEPTEPG